MSDRYTFRFTQEEIDEMRFVLEENAFSRPPRVEMEGMALSFNKARQEQGMMANVLVESVHRWFKKKRHNHFKAINTTTMMQNQMLALPCPVSEVEQALVRLEKYRNVQPDATKSNVLTVDEAKGILNKLKDISLVEFKNYEQHFELAVKTLTETGSLTKQEKTKLSAMLWKLRKVSSVNEDIRKAMAEHDAFIENLHECEESTTKLIRKANELEEKYDSFTQKISNCSQKIAELEAALKKAKAEEEVMKCKKDYIAEKLAGLVESLESANVHHRILKDEEGATVEKRIKLSQFLQKNAEEWVNITHSFKFTFV